jgi:hypothetical protein
MALFRIIGPLLLLSGLILVPLWGWGLWLKARLVRRRRLYAELAPRLGLHRRSDDIPAEQTEADLADVDTHMGGRRGGYRVDIYERLKRVRGQGVSTETQTVIEVSSLPTPLPEFLITPQDSHTRYLYHLTRTPHITVAGKEAFVTHNFVMGRDVDAIRAVLSRQVQAMLHGNTTLCVESTGRTLRFYRFDTLLDAQQIGELLTHAIAFTDTIAVAARQ